MNIAVIIYIIGWVIVVESVGMLFPALTGLIYMESTGFYYLGVAARREALRMARRGAGLAHLVHVGHERERLGGCSPFVQPVKL